MISKNYVFKIDEEKDFDIKAISAKEVTITTNYDNNVEILLSSDNETELDRFANVKINDTKSRFDIKIKLKLEQISINIKLPKKFIRNIEFNGNTNKISIINVNANNIETNGMCSFVILKNIKSHIELNSNEDMKISCINTFGQLDINQISAKSMLALKSNIKFIAENRGRKCKLNIDDNTIQSDSAEIKVELNGLKSTLTICKE